MNIDMKRLQTAILVFYSLDSVDTDYYYSKGNRVYPYRRDGDGNLFYKNNNLLSEHSPKYDINCIYER